MAVPWYEQADARDRLLVFGRAIQGVDPYQVTIEPNERLCHSGCCSFDLRRISVNPTIFPVPATEQYQLTKALLVMRQDTRDIQPLRCFRRSCGR